MARDIGLLEPDFQQDVRKLLKLCEDDGYVMKPFYTIRGVYEQAKLYRQSRPYRDIEGAHHYLKDNGADFLATVLLEVGPQSGRWATNALPGFSWHQHAEAIDCYWLLDGKAEWSTTKKHKGKNGYEVYANRAKELGLESGHFWQNKDSVHVQKTKGSISRMIKSGEMTYQELDQKMESMFAY